MSQLTLEHICTRLGVPGGFVEELVQARIIEVHEGVVTERTVERIRVSWSLHDELGVNLAGVEVALNLLERMQQDRRELADLLGDRGPDRT